MNRVPNQRYAQIIGEGLRVVPPRIRDRLAHVQFFCGTDPAFAGLHSISRAKDGRGYDSTPHCCYPRHLSQRPRSERVTTIVLPTLSFLRPIVVVHELGHALHELVGFDVRAEPTTKYATRNRFEAFAEAFTTWRYLGYGDDDSLFNDGATVALFEELAA